ncbi:hypothetical protein BGZ99_000554 [Dissophora globulifera]|uniref:Chromo domain-containing protein n=1 Tax=Dissophora globulifera TaxID=979702 RepID=A0A9P6R4Q7_9FUNG|nr:hypothetical protein BGZ99_000554 [Dissophora globulifera]
MILAEGRDFNEGQCRLEWPSRGRSINSTALPLMADTPSILQATETAQEMFGSFRSTIESYFGDMQSTFSKFCHTTVKRVSDKGIFALQYKLACLLLNIKRMVALRGIDSEPHHNLWTQDDFEYPDDSEQSSVQPTSPSLKTRINEAQSLALLQAAFLNLADVAPDSDLDMGDDNDHADAPTAYEVQKIMGHRREGEAVEYHVLWKGFDASDALWVPLSSFNETRVIEDHWNAKRSFGDP